MLLTPTAACARRHPDPATDSGFDVLIFTGEEAPLVEEVVVSVRTTETVDAPVIHVEPVANPVDESGGVVDGNSRFAAVSLRNDDSEPMSVRLSPSSGPMARETNVSKPTGSYRSVA